MSYSRLLGAVLLVAVGVAGSARASERPATAVVPDEVPPPQELARRGATIGRVDVYVQNIFDPADPREDHPLYRLANRLHYATRDATIRQQLLFRPGQRLDVQKLEETERILRARRYLNDAWVVALRYDAESNVVDIAVTVRDVWTLNPGVSLGRAGGRNHSGVQLDDLNLLGRGRQVGLSRSSDVDRNSTELSFFDPNLRRSWWQLGAAYAQNSDGRVRSFGLQRPFYSLDTHRAGGVTAYDGTSTVPLYSNGQIIDQFQVHHQLHQAFYGWSNGLVGGFTERWLAGVRYDESLFEPRPGALPPTSALPADRRFVYPWVGWQLVEDRYSKSENFDLIGRTEDLYLGRSLYAELGYSTGAVGGLGSSLRAHVAALDTWQPAAGQVLFGSATFDGRLDDGVAHNVSLNATGRYFARLTTHQEFYASLAARATRRLDLDQQLLLGGDTGLRGYPLRFQGGTSSALLTVEHRFYTNWYPFRLVRVGTAVFVDSGRTWGRDFAGAAPSGLLTDVGFGVRLGNNRWGLGNVVHIDLAYAIDAPLGARRYQVSASTQERF